MSRRGQFEKLTASHLYCNRCSSAMPVRERLLLVLPDGELYDFQCMGCGTSLGTRKEQEAGAEKGRIVLP